jgi:hypothetical protein
VLGVSWACLSITDGWESEEDDPAFESRPNSQIKSKSKTKSKSNGRFVAFIPASILSGLMEEGTVFIRTIGKKKKRSKNPSDEIENPQKLESKAVQALHSDLPAECVVELRGEDEIEPSQQESDDQESEANEPANPEAGDRSQEHTPEY